MVLSLSAKLFGKTKQDHFSRLYLFRLRQRGEEKMHCNAKRGVFEVNLSIMY